MRGFLACGALAAAALMSSAAQAAPSVEIRDAVARVVVIPEDRADVKVEFLTTNAALPLKIRREGERTVVDGDLRANRIQNCRSWNGHIVVNVRGVGDVGWKDMPQMVVHMPRNVLVEAGGAVFGSVGRTASFELDNAGCGDWTVGNTTGALKIRQAGSGDTRTGSAGSADIRIAGSGDVSIGQVAGGVSADIAGSGDVHAVSVAGDLTAKIAGSGDVKVDAGRAKVMRVSVAGSGDVSFDGVAETLDARIMGSGDINVGRVTGEVHKAVMGSGDVNIGD